MTELLDELRVALAGRYAIERLAGHGGMADVFLANDIKHGRPVALKVMRDVMDSVEADRFEREIEIAARLQHPNILPLYDSGTAGRRLYFVMPFVEGETLRKRLRRAGRMPWPDTLAATRDVANALTFAHEHNVVHRDIKPENVLFFGGHAVVADFGIARLIAHTPDEQITQAGFSVGTPAYMSPEQAVGDESLDARADLYSLASMVYEMLNGAPPFTGGTPMAMLARKAMQDAPRLPREASAGVPPHVTDVLDKALARDPDHRHASVAEFVAELSSDAPPAIGTGAALRGGTRSSIAVLPFTNLSGDPANDYLSDGMSDELIHSLSQIRELRVLSRTSSFAFKGRTDARAIGSELQVESVLDGSVRRAADRLRVTAQLIDARTGFQRWSERYDRDLVDVLQVQDDIARAIVDALRGELLPPEVAVPAAPAATAEAYDRYLEGRFLWNQRTVTSLERSVESLKRAIVLDRGFASAHAALAASYVTLAIYGAAKPGDVIPAARAAADRALEIGGPSPEALSARGCLRAVHDWDWAGAEADFVAATAAPEATSTAFQWYASNVLLPRGRFTEAREQLARARSLDPLSPVVALTTGLSHFFAGDPYAALREYTQVLDREPQFGMAHFFLGHAQTALGAHSAADEALQRAHTLLGATHEVISAQGVAAAVADERPKAVAALKELARRSKLQYVSPVLLAQIYAAMGDTGAALTCLESAQAQRASDLIWIGVRPVFDVLRGEARFAELLVAVGLRT